MYINTFVLFACILSSLQSTRTHALSADRIQSCQQIQSAYTNCIHAKMSANDIDLSAIQSTCTEWCFPFFTTAPTPPSNTYAACVTNAVNLCLSTQLTPGNITLQSPQQSQPVFDFRHIASASNDCQTCIRSVVGLTMSMDTLSDAQCIAYEECNLAVPRSVSSTVQCTTEMHQLYEAECACKQQLPQIMSKCQQTSSNVVGWNESPMSIRLCDLSENKDRQDGFRQLTC